MFAATTVTIAAGATPVLLVPGSPVQRKRFVKCMNVTSPAGSLALVAFGNASQAPTTGYQWVGTTVIDFQLGQGEDLYAGVVSSVVPQKLSIIMDLM